MEPTLPVGSVISFQFGIPRPGEVAVFQAGERIMVHRVLARWETRLGTYYVHAGDAGGASGMFAEHELIGIVDDVEIKAPKGVRALQLWVQGMLAKVYGEWRRAKHTISKS